MNPNAFSDKIRWYLHNQKTLSYLLIANLLAFILLRESFFTIFFFIYFLFFTSDLFCKMLHHKKLITSYAAGFSSGIFLFAAWQRFNTDPYSQLLWLSSLQAGILGVMTALTAYKPNHSFKIFIFPAIKLKYLIILVIVIHFLSLTQPEVYLAHLGGCIAGLLSGYTYRGVFSNFFKSLQKKKPRMHAEYNPKKPLNDDDYNAIKAEKQKRIDAILDKISKSGYESLSKEEKEFLFKSGNNN